jgi:hypothetical protein
MPIPSTFHMHSIDSMLTNGLLKSGQTPFILKTIISHSLKAAINIKRSDNRFLMSTHKICIEKGLNIDHPIQHVFLFMISVKVLSKYYKFITLLA